MKLRLADERGGPWFRLRLAVGDGLYRLAAFVTPKHRYHHRYSRDGKTITIWREPA